MSNDTWRERLGRVGVWHGGALGNVPASAAREAVAEIEELGYGSLWNAESTFKEVLSHAGLLLAASERLVIGTGIANVWARDPFAAKAGAATLGDAYPGRFILGLGVSHGPVAAARGQAYAKPYTRMREYLEAMEKAPYDGPRPSEEPPVVLAALRSKMLELARERTAGAHPYFVPVSHTERARAALGPEPLLIPELGVLVEADPGRAREIARSHTEHYLALPNYANSLRWLGFSDEDLAGGGSDRLVDAVVAWGTVEAIRDRVEEHLAAGADHVVVQPITPGRGLALDQLRELAPALTR